MNALENITMVSASAGTGKTYRLTQIIAEKIAAGVPASGIMATTFTKKAAGELRERIAAKLLDAPDTDQDPVRLRNAAQQLSVSLIGTVNGVCGRLLTEYAIDAGLSPALEVIAEEEQGAMFRLATDGVLADYADRLLPIARRLGQLDDDGGWDATVRRICDAARNNLLSPADLAGCAERSWAGFRELLDDRAATDDRSRWLRQFQDLLPELVSAARTGVDADGKAVKTTAANFAGKWPGIGDRIAALGAPEHATWEQWRGIIQSSTNAWIVKHFQDATDAVKEGLLANPAFHDDAEGFIRLVFECAAACLDTYADFKRRHGLMDFVDQETLVVSLVRHNQAFRDSFRQRVKFLVVDEFQDTSPLQLELFLQLSRLVDECVWVGDPKQAIYEFRGTDPDLMQAVVANVAKTERLHESWRSQQAVVNLSNAVFEPVFAAVGMARESVHLDLPAAHAGWPQGTLEAWTKDVPKGASPHAATAAGVADLLARLPELKPADVAVLARSNDDVASLAAALGDLGIRTSLNPNSLFAAREIQLVRAAMAFVADARDTVALAEIVALHPGHGAHADWQPALLGSAAPADVLEAWALDPVPAALAGLRERAGRATPTEVFEEAVSLLGLPELIKSWSAPATRLRNLDAFRACLNNYYEACKVLKTPATLRGFLRFLADEEQNGAENSGDDVVHVMTYHKAKGLEWPVVVMESLDKGIRAGAFGTAVEQSASFDVANPLAGRWIRFWPKPFPHGGSPLDDRAKTSDVQARAEERERRNQSRLMYVGMTRSKETTVLAAKSPAPAALNLLGVPDLLAWSGSGGDGAIHVAGSEPLPASVHSYEPGGPGTPAGDPAVVRFTDARPRMARVQYPAARIQASKQASGAADATVLEKASLGERLLEHGAAGWDAVGSAIHAYLGTAYETLSPDDRLGLAKQIIDRWQVGDHVTADVLVSSGERLARFLHTTYPGAGALREVPIGWRNGDNQVMEGWIDLLVEAPAGYVLIDHKSYPGTDPAGHIQEKYLGQLEAYREAVLAATGRPVLETLIHLPALGKVFAVV
ncbi:UvrD-helicase domain-containing protein [Arthrobacter sp. I2-34]|uniref:DNA 3'-5' helicase n=1 Tax=Arthrobacter hankyongi TaxID=2904801 RepID=A0ABS9L2K5_9MICC|nr:UvrD-helicase domain-containing protein [Arthrobacter hankyongi]MCG2620891.1 UvrD-helicase domain-containing protein [Arthrobacter hankyongi]